jgi:hypothetical protein
MNLKTGPLNIKDMRILRFQGFKARTGAERILSPLRGEGEHFTPDLKSNICLRSHAFWLAYFPLEVGVGNASLGA